MRDVFDCVFFRNAKAPLRDDGCADWSPFACPIASVEMNGRFPFVLLRGKAGESGRVNVISEKALKELGVAALQVLHFLYLIPPSFLI